jgi:hypothetical protein
MKSLACILVILACAVTTLTGADPVELKPHWDAGKKYFFTTLTSQQSTITLGTVKTEQTVGMTMEMSVAVRAHEDGKRKRLNMRYERVAMEILMNGQKLSYDSAKPGDNTDPLGLGKSVGLMVGKELRFVTDEKDIPMEVENYEEFVEQMKTAGSTAGMDVTKMFTREGLLETMKQGSLQAFPDHPVAPGESWSFATKVTMSPQIGTVTVKGTYTFKGMADHGGAQCAEILTDGSLSLEAAEGSDAGTKDLGVKNMKGTLKGPVWIDPQLGMAREANVDQDMSMSIKNPLDGSGGDLTVPMKQTVKTTLTRVEDLK